MYSPDKHKDSDEEELEETADYKEKVKILCSKTCIFCVKPCHKYFSQMICTDCQKTHRDKVLTSEFVLESLLQPCSNR
jgi:hypothetical protein